MSCEGIASYDFSLVKGDDYALHLRYANNDSTSIAISGYTIILECSNPALTTTAIILDPTDGTFKFEFSGSDTLAVDSRVLKYEVVFYPTGLAGTKSTMFSGKLTLIRENVL